VAELVQQNVVLQNLRETYNVEIQIDIPPGGATAPIGGVVLDGDALV
jgi:hypothetical protein